MLALLLALPLAASGSLWPLPAALAPGPAAFPLAASFRLQVVGGSTPLLDAALARYASLLQLRALPATPYAGPLDAAHPLGLLSITLNSTNPEQRLDTSEAYSLSVAESGAALVAATWVGALRGLETFSQLVEYTPSLAPGYPFLVPACEVVDAPRFAHRGALVDTSRHFIALPQLRAFLDAMAYNKLNVFHCAWPLSAHRVGVPLSLSLSPFLLTRHSTHTPHLPGHIVDDNSFPWQSETYPQLSALGAYAPADAHTYSPADVQAVLAYAQARGIRTVVELDTPGHTQSWGRALPGLTTQCFNASGLPDGTRGPIDPTREENWVVLGALLAEAARVFPDEYMHVGGDEVSFACWASNPSVNAWMAAHNFTQGDYAGLESYYVQRVLALVQGLGKTPIGWQEVYDNHLNLTARTIVNVWKYHNAPCVGGSDGSSAQTWQGELANVTAAGYYALLSSPWYLNIVQYAPDWEGFYLTEPLNFTGSAAQKSLVIGGELSVWGEYVDATNLLSRTFPRGSAVAERLWSAASVRDAAGAALRINDQRCRMLARGVTAGPLLPSSCPAEAEIAYNPPF